VMPMRRVLPPKPICACIACCAGKSSLISMLARHWTVAGERVGVLAIDPTSPLSGGSLLGDRVRMDEAAEDSRLYIRSLPSGGSSDGLCPNVSSLLDAFEQAGFDHLVLETVGVGQVNHEGRCLVDAFVLVLNPESGDTIQAMKAGIMEVADIYVVNKADLPGAEKLAAELRSIAVWRSKGSGWTPPVILTSMRDARGVAELAEAITAHGAAVLDTKRRQELQLARRDYHLRSLLQRHVDDIVSHHAEEVSGMTTAEACRFLLSRLGDG
jgi:LAO/AO transport system kinase